MGEAKPTLVLLPGLLCDDAVWSAVGGRLRDAADCTVPGYAGESSLGAMARRVLAAAPDRFALAGHSMGARVALEVMASAPGRVERLALLDTGCRPLPPGAAGEEERAGRMALLALARERGMRAMAREWVRRMVHPDRLGEAGLIEAILDMFARRTPEDFAAQIRALLARPDREALLREAACPTLLLCGREDAWSPPAQHEEMAAMVRDSRLAILERCGHMSPMERPDRVAAELLAWLRVPARRAPFTVHVPQPAS